MKRHNEVKHTFTAVAVLVLSLEHDLLVKNLEIVAWDWFFVYELLEE